MLENNELSTIKHGIFMLLCQLENNLAENISKDKVDAQAMFALSKLVDSFIKLSDAEILSSSKQKNNKVIKPISHEDTSLLSVYSDSNTVSSAFSNGIIEDAEDLGS